MKTLLYVIWILVTLGAAWIYIIGVERVVITPQCKNICTENGHGYIGPYSEPSPFDRIPRTLIEQPDGCTCSENVSRSDGQSFAQHVKIEHVFLSQWMLILLRLIGIIFLITSMGVYIYLVQSMSQKP